MYEVHKFSYILQEIEDKKDLYNVKDQAISITTLEQVFLNINQSDKKDE